MLLCLQLWIIWVLAPGYKLNSSYFYICFARDRAEEERFLQPALDMGLPGGLEVKNLPANAGDARDMGSIPGQGRSPREGNGSQNGCDPKVYKQ